MHGIGKAMRQPGDASFQMHDVRYIPHSKFNILSLGQLQDQNFNCNYRNDRFVVHSPDGDMFEAIRCPGSRILDSCS